MVNCTYIRLDDCYMLRTCVALAFLSKWIENLFSKIAATWIGWENYSQFNSNDAKCVRNRHQRIYTRKKNRRETKHKKKKNVQPNWCGVLGDREYLPWTHKCMLNQIQKMLKQHKTSGEDCRWKKKTKISELMRDKLQAKRSNKRFHDLAYARSTASTHQRKSKK